MEWSDSGALDGSPLQARGDANTVLRLTDAFRAGCFIWGEHPRVGRPGQQVGRSPVGHGKAVTPRDGNALSGVVEGDGQRFTKRGKPFALIGGSLMVTSTRGRLERPKELLEGTGLA